MAICDGFLRAGRGDRDGHRSSTGTKQKGTSVFPQENSWKKEKVGQYFIIIIIFW